MERIFNTSAVSGMTDIPIKTIQRYVKDFHDFFSETARQPKKGRRFTGADVQNLFTIRRGRSKGHSDAEIKQALSDPSSTPLEQEFRVEDALELTAHALGLVAQADTTLKAIDKKAEQMQLLYNELRRMVYGMNERVTVLEVTKRPARTQPVPEIKEREAENKKPGLLQRFNNYLDIQYPEDEEE